MGIDPELTIQDLADREGVPVRTIRYYVAEGLLPGPGMRGKGTSYNEEHLLRLRLIRRLVDQRVPLQEIREQLSRLTMQELRFLVVQANGHAVREEKARDISPREYLSTLLNRATLREGRALMQSLDWDEPRSRTADASYATYTDTVRTRPDEQRLEDAGAFLFPARTAAMEPAAEVAPRQAPVPSASVAESQLPQRPRTERWERYELAPGVELHVRSDAGKMQRGLIERLLDLARHWRQRQLT